MTILIDLNTSNQTSRINRTIPLLKNSKDPPLDGSEIPRVPPVRRWRGGRAVEAGRERSGSGLGALKSTGSRRRVPRSASPARAAPRQCASRQPQPAAAPDLGRYLRHLNRPQSLYSHCPGNKTATVPRYSWIRIRSQYGRNHWE